MNVFVTGATGFAGRHLCRMLINKGHKVRALVRTTSNTAALYDLGVDIVAGDIREKSSFSTAVKGSEIFYHLAAVYREAKLSAQDYMDVNFKGTKNAVKTAAEAGVGRFVHCSTIGVFGDTGTTPATEDRPFGDPKDSYNRSKIEGELIARELFEKLNIRGVVVRPSAGYGPGELRYLKLFKRIKRGRFVMIGSGKTLYNLAYIDDLCEGIILSGTHPQAGGQIFNIAGEENISLNQLVCKIAAAVKGRSSKNLNIPLWPFFAAALMFEGVCRPLRIEPPLHRRQVEFFTVNRASDISKAKHQLGYQPKVLLSEGLQRTAAWYEGVGLM
jgi:nucleoside-diphosphate-sugar epimerase